MNARVFGNGLERRRADAAVSMDEFGGWAAFAGGWPYSKCAAPASWCCCLRIDDWRVHLRANAFAALLEQTYSPLSRQPFWPCPDSANRCCLLRHLLPPALLNYLYFRPV